MTILAQIGANYSLAQLVIFAIIACGVIAIGAIFFREKGVAIPGWMVQVFWVVVAVVVCVFAIKFLAGIV